MTTDKRITGLSEEARKRLLFALTSEAEQYTFNAFLLSNTDDPASELAAAYEALAELVESAGREGE